jgi:hypothetical protein
MAPLDALAELDLAAHTEEWDEFVDSEASQAATNYQKAVDKIIDLTATCLPSPRGAPTESSVFKQATEASEPMTDSAEANIPLTDSTLIDFEKELTPAAAHRTALNSTSVLEHISPLASFDSANEGNDDTEWEPFQSSTPMLGMQATEPPIVPDIRSEPSPTIIGAVGTPSQHIGLFNAGENLASNDVTVVQGDLPEEEWGEFPDIAAPSVHAVADVLPADGARLEDVLDVLRRVEQLGLQEEAYMCIQFYKVYSHLRFYLVLELI